MLPRADDATLRSYLLSVAETIHKQINLGRGPVSDQRLRECATIVARVAQQLEDRLSGPRDTASEAAALSTAERNFAADEEGRVRAGLAPPPPTDRILDVAALNDWLHGHPMGGAALTLHEARLLPGGRCKLTALVRLTGAAALPEQFVLRQDWAGGATDTSVAGEYALLREVAGAGILAPRPLLLETGDALGAPFILLEMMPGSQSGSLFTPPLSPSLARALAEQMGRLHALPIERFESIVPRAEADPDALRQTLAGFAEMQRATGLKTGIIDAAIAWLGDNIDQAGNAFALTHNDLGFHNCLIEDDKLTAILDWELAGIGHPAADLGYVKPFVPMMLPWEQFLECYEASGGWRVEPQVLRFHTIWNAVRLYGLIMQARAALAAGHVNDIEITFACADNTMLLLDCLARELIAA